MSVNKFFKQPSDSAANNSGEPLRDPSDRLVWEMRNFRQYYHGRSPQNQTPSSTVLNSPDVDIDRMDHYNRFSDELRNDIPSDGGPCIDYRYENRLVSGRSPTSSHSSNSENCVNDPQAKRKIIGGLQITNLDESPRRVGGNASHQGDQAIEARKSQEFQRFSMRSPGGFPRRAPGFPQRVVTSNTHEHEEASNDSYQKPEPRSIDPYPEEYEQHPYEFSDTRKALEDFFSPQQHQQLQQQKLLEFQQRSKRQQVEKVLPLDDLVNFDSNAPQSSATYIGQRLAALKQIQQKQHYEHQLQQQYENRRFIEDAESSKPSLQLHENIIAEEDLDEQNYYAYNNHQTNNFTMSPETTDYESNCEDLDSEFSLRYLCNDPSLSTDVNGTMDGRSFSSIAMPVLEDGLSSEHGSDTENNNTDVTSILDLSIRNQSPRHTLNESSEIVEPSSSPTLDTSGADCRSNNNIYASKESVSSGTAAETKPKDDEEADTDLETDRLLGQQRMAELQGKNLRIVRCANGQIIKSPKSVTKTQTFIRQGIGTQSPEPVTDGDKSYRIKSPTNSEGVEKTRRTDEGTMLDPDVLIEGILFRARYLGTTQLVCEGRPTKSLRMMQAEEAVSRIKAPEGESQPKTEVDLFISTEKIMVLNTDLKEIMMDHALKTISYIADIGDLVVLMARRRPPPPAQQDNSSNDSNPETPSASGSTNRTPKMICHVFESESASFIAQCIGEAFQVAYMEFLKANGIEDHSFMKEMDYQEVLNSQEIYGDELEIFAKKERQKEVVVPKAKGEILGVVIVESGWGSMLPTVVIANMAPSGAAARCGHLNIGDQITSVNGLSLVGLPLTQCQTYIKNTKNQTAVKFTIVPCAPVVEVKIKRPNTKYQLGFSVQNGVICSLLRGGIAERGGVRVGHRIIEINNQSVVAVSHDKIVNLLATSVGEILMKTMPTSMFRLLTGQENPIYI